MFLYSFVSFIISPLLRCLAPNLETGVIMKELLSFLTVILLTGCVSINLDPNAAQSSLQGRKELSAVNKLRVGMSYDEVIATMGNHLTIGYDIDPQNPGQIKPITLASPYRQLVLKTRTGTYEVLYYYTHVKNPDGVIAEDELTPLVFKDKKLIGLGIDFLFKIKNETEF